MRTVAALLLASGENTATVFFDGCGEKENCETPARRKALRWVRTTKLAIQFDTIHNVGQIVAVEKLRHRQVSRRHACERRTCNSQDTKRAASVSSKLLPNNRSQTRSTRRCAAPLDGWPVVFVVFLLRKVRATAECNVRPWSRMYVTTPITYASPVWRSQTIKLSVAAAKQMEILNHSLRFNKSSYLCCHSISY